MSARQSIYIDAPVHEVFDLYKDPRRTWALGPDQMVRRGELIDVTMTDDGVGTYYSWAFHLPGLRLEGFDVFTEFVPNERITDRSSRSFVGTWTATFAPEGTGTRLTQWRHPVATRALRPLDRLFDRFRRSVGQEELEHIKAELEKRVAPAAPRAGAGAGRGGAG